MTYFDRFTGQMTSSLPKHMDLGRFAVIDNGVVRDLTNVDVIQMGDYVIRESLFEETNQNIHDLLQTIASSYANNMINVTPIIQKFNIEIKEFEKILNEHKSHLREIIANPHSLLDKNTMKVNIGRAKRISNRSYQYLAHHSEDWEKMSILSPKPMKILHEELIVDYLVYENILLKAFLHEAIKHLSKRVKETADINKFFLSIFGAKWICPNCRYEYVYKSEEVEIPDFCPSCNQQVDWIEEINTIWAEKIERRNALVGRALKTDKSKDSGATNRTLAALKAELVKLEHSQLFEYFPKHAADSVVYHDTNVLNSHKHYKYLKVLWLELKKTREQTEESKDPFIVMQEIMNNMRTYVETLFVYSLRQMGYLINEENGSVIAKHASLPNMKITSDRYNILHLSIENTGINIISLGGIYDIESTMNLPKDTICFCFSDYQKNQENIGGVYFVNPMDTNSIEYSGQIIRKLIISYYITIVNKRIKYKSNLRDFITVIENQCQEIIFDKMAFTFSFSNKLPYEIDERQILASLKDMPTFKQRNKRDQDNLLKDMSNLVDDINNWRTEIKKTLVCPKCFKHYRSRDIRYLICDCGFVSDISNNEVRFFHQHKDDSYSKITAKGWGMDYIE